MRKDCRSLGSCLCGKIAGSESFLDSTRRMVEPWLRFGCVVVEGWLWRAEVPDGWCGVRKRLYTHKAQGERFLPLQGGGILSIMRA